LRILYKEQEIRSVKLRVCPMQLFHIWSCDVHPGQNLLLCTKFHQNQLIFHWDIAIYRFLKWRPSAILELFYHHTRPPTKSVSDRSCLSNFMSCDTQIWRFFNFSHIWLEMPIQAPKMRVLEDVGTLNVIIHHRDPKRHILA